MYAVKVFTSGNGRNKCAGVFHGEECVATYHIRDVGPAYHALALAHCARLNGSDAR